MSKEELIKRIESIEKEQRELFRMLFNKFPPESGNTYGMSLDGKVREFVVEE